VAGMGKCGQWREMAQTMYTYMNKCISKEKFKNLKINNSL
jgi:hypothetical protein